MMVNPAMGLHATSDPRHRREHVRRAAARLAHQPYRRGRQFLADESGRKEPVPALEQALVDLGAQVQDLKGRLWTMQDLCPGCAGERHDDAADCGRPQMRFFLGPSGRNQAN